MSKHFIKLVSDASASFPKKPVIGLLFRKLAEHYIPPTDQEVFGDAARWPHGLNAVEETEGLLTIHTYNSPRLSNSYYIVELPRSTMGDYRYNLSRLVSEVLRGDPENQAISTALQVLEPRHESPSDTAALFKEWFGVKARYSRHVQHDCRYLQKALGAGTGMPTQSWLDRLPEKAGMDIYGVHLNKHNAHHDRDYDFMLMKCESKFEAKLS